MVDDPGRSASSPGRVRSLRAGADSVVVSRPGQTGRMEVWSTLENRLSSGVGVGTLLWPPVGATTGGRLWPARIFNSHIPPIDIEAISIVAFGMQRRILVVSRSVVSVVKMTASSGRRRLARPAGVSCRPPSGPQCR